MFEMDVHVDGLKDLERRLGTLSPAAKDIMNIALNETAKESRRSLADKARETYMVQYGAFNKSMRIKRSTKSRLEAAIHSHGKPIALRGFAYVKHNRESKEPAKAHQLRGKRNVSLEKYGNKTFYSRMPTGHTGLFVRVPGSTMSRKVRKNENGKWEMVGRDSKKENKPREQIEELFGSSIPVMLGGTRVYGEMKPQIQEKLEKKLDRYVDQVLRRV